MTLPVIVVVGGSPAARASRALALQHAGFEIAGAAGGEEALRIVSERKPDAAIVELAFPDGDPIDLSRHLREAAPGMRVIHLADNIDSAAQLRSLVQGGADCLLPAGVEVPVLAAQIRALLRRAGSGAASGLAAERLKLARAGAQIGIFDWDLTANEASWSGPLEHPCGQPLREFTGSIEHCLSLLHPEDRESFGRRFAELKVHGGRLDTRVRAVRPDGTVRWFRALGATIAGRDGRPAHLSGVTVDITGDVEAEQRLRTLADAIPQMVWVSRGERVEYMNARMLGYFGISANEIGTVDCTSWVHPEDRTRAVALLEPGCAGQEYEAECRLRRAADGAWRWHLVRAVPVHGPAGAADLWFGTCTDIELEKEGQHALRRIEKRFRALWERHAVGLITTDTDTVLEANEVFLNLCGANLEQLLAGAMNWRRMTPAEYAGADEQALAQALDTGCCDPYEKEFARPDGKRVPVLVGITLLERDPVRLLCFVVDLTAHKELEKKLIERQKLQSMGVLAGGLAHEFNNLLTGILGNASLARDALMSGSFEHHLLGEVLQAAQSAATLTQQMLAYSGKGRVFVRALNLSTLIQRHAGLLRAGAKHVQVNLDLPPGLPMVEADAGQMQQLLVNLVMNAAEAIGDHSGAIFIRTGTETLDEHKIRHDLAAQELEPGLYVCIEVRDTGCGMDEATRARIFDPFFSTKFQGRGLGLAAVAGIVRAHRGAILVETAPDEGSTFRVLLPSAASLRAPREVESSVRGAGGVLVVDDEDQIREVAKMILECCGYTVWTARDGREAIRSCEELGARVSAVLLDLTIPGLSGVEVLETLRKRRPELRVVLATGFARDEASRLLGPAGATEFIQKPYTAAELAAKIKAVLALTILCIGTHGGTFLSAVC